MTKKKIHSSYNLPYEDLFMPEPNSGCWIWLGVLIDVSRDRGKYGRFWVDGKYELAHRYPFLPLPSNKEVHHKCRNTMCVNPDHLQIVTSKEHRIAEGRSSETHFTACGHKKTKENTYAYKGNSYCRTCNAQKHKDARIQRAQRKRSDCLG